MRVTIITDASRCSDTGGSGFGYWIASERGKLGGGGAIKGKTDCSSAAEMMAVVNAIHDAVAKGLLCKKDHALLQTDCMAAIEAFQGSRSRLSHDEKKAKSAFFELKRKIEFTFSFRHVKGHTSRPEARYVTNNLCDQRAKKGMRLAREQLNGLSEDSGS